MQWLVVTGVKPWDGRYPFDLDDGLTTREWGLIKNYSGYMPLDIADGFDGGDAELYACFAAIALRRAGKIENADVDELMERLFDAPFGSTVQIDGDDVEEDDAGPPPSRTNGNESSPGTGSPTRSETSEALSSVSGTPASASSASPSTRSET